MSGVRASLSSPGELRSFLSRSGLPEGVSDELLEYVISILADEELSGPEEAYEALGEILAEMLGPSTSDEGLQSLCEELYELSLPEGRSRSGGGKEEGLTLSAPICLGDALMGAGEDLEDQPWKNGGRRIVDRKKLEKAEKALQKKAANKSGLPPKEDSNSSSTGLSASASQRISKTRGDSNSVKDIRLEGVDVAFGEKVLISNADITLVHGRRFGLVGRNGLGKSTLLRMLSSSQLIIPSHISILHVEQEVIGDDTTALDSVLEADTVRSALLKEAASGGSPRLNEIYVELEAMEADKAPSKASVILCGLGFTSEMQARATKAFSGGWRMRIALARALFLKPDLLLLDEPTNMLDMEAIVWLERYLQKWSSTLFVVSHNRNFLDEVTTDIIHLHSQRLDSYRGNYTEFVNTMTERLKAQRREYEAQLEYRKHVQDFIDKFRFNAKRASLVQSRIKHLEKLPVLVPVEKETEVTLRFPEVAKLSPPILVLSEVAFSYDGSRTIFSNVDLSATLDSRICIVGRNGSGKSTLLKLIMEKVTETAGRRTVHRGLKFGYFSQHHVDQLDMNVCPLEIMKKRFPDKKMEECRRLLGHFGIGGDLALQKTVSLSGGQKSRVAFAVICAENPNFLILDEPTNHLDIETIDALGKALLNYKGGLILVCHDEKLLRMVCKELWVCADGSVKPCEGGFEEYRKALEATLEL
eukprot:TRINITY_DN1262_c1_g1_i2.p1 TRINITY_DN1262_c1_g1~~TRINITY_DN1262_c1_g1_i2.p1  ORF type:complete len:701 (-),score=246.04 TRINITY_DN1262_c1_g1_i2:141-2243(-)